MKALNDLYLDICQAVAGSSAIDAWCNIYYGQGHTVYMGWDVEALPTQDLCPVCGIVPFRQRKGRESSREEIGFSVYGAIYDDTSVTGAYGNLTEFSGVRRIEDYRKLIQDAIVAVDRDGGRIGTVESAYDPVSEFPLFEVVFDMTIIGDVTIGNDPLA